MPPGSDIEMAYHLEWSEFSGVEYIELRARDLRLLKAKE
jgi:hypothetical protein